MLIVFRSEISCLVVVATLSTHWDRCVQVKLEIAWWFDKLFKLINVFQLGIAIQEKSSMIGRCLVVLMELLKILNQVMYALSVKELQHVNNEFQASPETITFRMTCEGSVLSMAFKYCCMALSYSPFWYNESPYFRKIKFWFSASMPDFCARFMAGRKRLRWYKISSLCSRGFSWYRKI